MADFSAIASKERSIEGVSRQLTSRCTGTPQFGRLVSKEGYIRPVSLVVSAIALIVIERLGGKAEKT